MAKAVKKEEALPDAEEQELLMSGVRAFAREERFARVRNALDALASGQIPQTMLLEGGNADERRNAALYWAALLNCAHSSQGGPCLECPQCLRLASTLHRDIFFFDGQAGNIAMDSVREMRAVLGEPPREAAWRAVIFSEAQSMRPETANALLKSLEEPRPQTVFVLAAPQRERLLPTLVSRSWVLTLPWKSGREAAQSLKRSEELDEWAGALLDFTREGKNWMARTSRKGTLDAELAAAFVVYCQAALLRALSAGAEKDGQSAPGFTALAARLADLPDQQRRIFSDVLAECQDSLIYTVNPVLVMDWLATRFYFLKN